jgi:seryl-tRNA synthetase
MRLPNVLHESVPVGKDDTENQEVRKWGDIPKFDFELRPHGELIEERGLANFEDAAKVSGKGFYYLIGDLALLEQALQRFAIDSLTKKKFSLVEPPFMLRREPYEGVTDLSDFENIMYKVEGENEDLFLIATSEHPIGALMMNKVLDEKDMPIKYCGVSACFRKEIGSHGVDERGLFRVHQFNKIEQFIFCKPEDSWKLHEELIGNAEELFKKLKLPYRIVNICTGDIGIVAAKKFDLEVWMPRENEYKEAVSCSNCTSYQAVRLNIKYKKGSDKEYIHTLNSTAIATGRALRAIIENYQQKDGSIKVPAVLVPYMNGIKVIGKK